VELAQNSQTIDAKRSVRQGCYVLKVRSVSAKGRQLPMMADFSMESAIFRRFKLYGFSILYKYQIVAHSNPVGV